MTRGSSEIAPLSSGKYFRYRNGFNRNSLVYLVFGFGLLDILFSVFTFKNEDFLPSVAAVLPTGQLQFTNLDLNNIYTGDPSNFVSDDKEGDSLYVEGPSFGDDLWNSKSDAPTLIALLPSGHLDGCDSETSNFDYYTEGKAFAAVFQRGNCSFGQKVSVGEKAGASAVAAGSIFHFSDYTPNHLKDAMFNAGIPVRL